MRRLVSLSLILISLSSPAQCWADDYDTICGNVTSTTTTGAGQVYQYCQQALAAKNAYTADNLVWKVYAAVAVVCTAQCATSAMDFATIPYGNYICMGSGLGAAATDAVMTKQYTTAMTAAMASMSGLLIGSGSGSGSSAASDADAASSGGSKGTDIGSCVAAAGAAFSSFEKNQAAQTDKSSEAQSLQLALQLENAPATGTFSNPSTLNAIGNNAVVTGNTITANHVSTAPKVTGVTPTSAGNCGANSSSSVSTAVQCAATANPTVASLVGSPQFGQAFEKAAGMPLAGFLSGATRPSSAIAQGMGALSSPDGVAAMQAALAQMEGQPVFDGAGSTYAGGGGGEKSASGEDMSGLVNNLLTQLGPKKTAGKESNGVSQASFSTQRAIASATAEDRTVSLFERIAYRYTKLSPNLLPVASSSSSSSSSLSKTPGVPTLKEW